MAKNLTKRFCQVQTLCFLLQFTSSKWKWQNFLKVLKNPIFDTILALASHFKASNNYSRNVTTRFIQTTVAYDLAFDSVYVKDRLSNLGNLAPKIALFILYSRVFSCQKNLKSTLLRNFHFPFSLFFNITMHFQLFLDTFHCKRNVYESHFPYELTVTMPLTHTTWVTTQFFKDVLMKRVYLR